MKTKLAISDLWPMLKDTVNAWLEDKAPKMSAALAYYTAISLAPLIVITIKVIGVVAGPKAASQSLHDQLAKFTDPQIASALQETISKAGQPGAGTVATIVSIVIALFGASGLFAELQDSLNTIWEVKTKSDRPIFSIIRDRFLSMTMVLGIAFLLLVSMALSWILLAVSSGLIGAVFGSNTGTAAKVIGFCIDLVFSTAVVTTLFAAMFKLLPDVKISWKDVWFGAFTTALLFQIGKYGLSLYLGKASPTSAYGAAGSMVAVLLWVYYSSQILYFGAELTRVYANKFGTQIVPTANAEPLTEEMRAQQGIPRTKPKPTSTPVSQTNPWLTLKRPSNRPVKYRPVGPEIPARRYSYIARYLPIATGIVLGRFAWKQYHPTAPLVSAAKNSGWSQVKKTIEQSARSINTWWQSSLRRAHNQSRS